AQGFELPASGGRLDLTYETPATHTLWIWAQGFGLLVLTILALPGRRVLVDDMPDAEPVTDAPQGRRARRLAAATAAGAAGAAGAGKAPEPPEPPATAESADAPEAPGSPPPPPPGPVPVPEQAPAPDAEEWAYQDQG